MGMLLDGRAQPTGIKRSGADATLLLLLNAHHDGRSFQLPEVAGGKHWSCLIDTHRPDDADEQRLQFGETLELAGRSLQLLELQR